MKLIMKITNIIGRFISRVHTSIHSTSLKFRRILSMTGPIISSVRRRRTYREMLITKILISSLTATLCFSQAYIKLLDMNGVRLKQAGVGVPFILKIDIESGANDNLKPEIEGLDNPNITVKYDGTSSTITNIAGQVSVERSFKYYVRIDSEGTYKIGPAKLYVQGDVLESNVVDIKVGSSQISKKQSNKKIDLNISVDNLNPYQGQKIDFTLNLKGAGQLNIVGISEPDLNNFNISNVEGPFQETTFEKGERILHYRWHYSIYPKNSGKLVIPSVSVILKVPDEDSQSFFSSFFNSYKKETLYSNSVVLNVKKLPKGKFDAIGNFTKFSAKLDKNNLNKGDAALVKIEISGDADLTSLDFDLKSVPENLKAYKSNSKIEGNTKIFEFILQGLKEGEYIIPAQNFRYFDPIYEKSDILKTKQLKIIFNKSKDLIKEEKKLDDDGLYSIVDYEYSYRRPFYLPQFIFFLLLFVPLFFSLFLYIFRLFKNSRKYKLLLLKKNLNHSELYKVFVELAALKLNISKNKIDKKDLENLLKDSKWHVFIENLSEYKFSNRSEKSDIKLKEEAEYWFNILEKS